jgi:hypothetical protein
MSNKEKKRQDIRTKYKYKRLVLKTSVKNNVRNNVLELTQLKTNHNFH